MKKYLILTLVFAVMMLTLSVGAQDDEQLSIDDFALVVFVSSGFNRLQEMTSTTVESSLNMQTEYQSGEQHISQALTGEMVSRMLLEEGQIAAFQVLGTQDTEAILDPGLDLTGSASIEFRFVDGVSYVRFYDLPPLMTLLYPNGWVTLSDDEVYMAGLEPLSSEQFSMYATLTEFGNLYTHHTVSSIEELPEETLEDGTTTRVFDIALDVEQAFLGSEEYWRTVLGLSIYSIGSYRFRNEIMPSMTFNSMIWIDTETEVVAQMEIDLAIDTELRYAGAASADFQMMLSLLNVYAQFNEDFEITAPEMEE